MRSILRIITAASVIAVVGSCAALLATAEFTSETASKQSGKRSKCEKTSKNKQAENLKGGG